MFEDTDANRLQGEPRASVWSGVGSFKMIAQCMRDQALLRAPTSEISKLQLRRRSRVCSRPQASSGWLSGTFAEDHSSKPRQLHRSTRSRRTVVRHAALAAALSSEVAAVRPIAPAELAQVAKLRAEAYYEGDRSRFVQSYKRQFADQEVASLKERTARGVSSGAPACDCLVAIDAAGNVLGCIDIRLPASRTGKHPTGVPDNDPDGCYILNVVVAERCRAQGVGSRLMRAAMKHAVSMWQARTLYTHVAADNEVAYKLYTRCGFVDHSTDGGYEGALTLGRLILLSAPDHIVSW